MTLHMRSIGRYWLETVQGPGRYRGSQTKVHYQKTRSRDDYFIQHVIGMELECCILGLSNVFSLLALHVVCRAVAVVVPLRTAIARIREARGEVLSYI